MTSDDHDGRGTLRDRLPPVLPRAPDALADRVRATLTSRGLIREPADHRALWLGRLGLLAAGILLGVMSITLAQRLTRTSRASAPRYALLLYGDPPGDTGTVHAARAREYGQWASRLGDGARWVGGNEMGRVLETFGAPPAPIASAPAPTGGSTTERMAGIFIIEAATPARAAQVARSCPHLKYGGRVVLMSVAL
jgi:hypothetical protein